jgi:hypothetical protein
VQAGLTEEELSTSMVLQLALDAGEPPGPLPSSLPVPSSSSPGASSYATTTRLGLAAPSGPVVGGGNPGSSPPALLGKWGQSSSSVRTPPPSQQPLGIDKEEQLGPELPSLSGPLAISLLGGAHGAASPGRGAWSGGMPKGRGGGDDQTDVGSQRKSKRNKQVLKGFFE